MIPTSGGPCLAADLHCVLVEHIETLLKVCTFTTSFSQRPLVMYLHKAESHISTTSLSVSNYTKSPKSTSGALT